MHIGAIRPSVAEKLFSRGSQYLYLNFFFSATVVPRRENINIVNVTQLEKDAILVCYDSKF